jgi:diadenosine tetraphosphate (Ap4A) HIT family hydrolase
LSNTPPLYTPPLYNVNASRDPDQRAYMEELEARGECLFCPDFLLNDTSQTVVRETPGWIVIRNRFPYSGTSEHLLLVPRPHVTRISDLDEATQAGFWQTLNQVIDELGITTYSIGARNGDPELTRATVAHAHVHVLVPDGSTPLRMRLG